MKIQTSIRRSFQDLEPKYGKLQKEVESRLKAKLQRGWHFEDRVKRAESFALKLETGRVSDLADLEDFYACTIVVRNRNEISDAENAVCGLFSLEERRPKEANKTNLYPSNFPFDDLRLYVRWKDDPDLRPSGLDGLKFEVQVKTFLQHAWAIATHDLIYKSDEASWGKERIASQVRAMLDHAEISIQEAEQLSKAKALQMEQKSYKELTEIIHLLKAHWETDFLPNDLKRQASNVLALLNATNISASRLKHHLVCQAKKGRGYKFVNLSPYSAVLQTLFDTEGPKMEKLASAERIRNRIVITPEIEVIDRSIYDRSPNFIVMIYE